MTANACMARDREGASDLDPFHSSQPRGILAKFFDKITNKSLF
jgi:hypothetical protein